MYGRGDRGGDDGRRRIGAGLRPRVDVLGKQRSVDPAGPELAVGQDRAQQIPVRDEPVDPGPAECTVQGANGARASWACC